MENKNLCPHCGKEIEAATETTAPEVAVWNKSIWNDGSVWGSESKTNSMTEAYNTIEELYQKHSPQSNVPKKSKIIHFLHSILRGKPKQGTY